MRPRAHGVAVRQLLRAARAGLQSEIGLRAKLAADWARAEASAGGSSAKPVPELDGSLPGAFHAECLARNSRDAAAALSLSMRTFRLSNGAFSATMPCGSVQPTMSCFPPTADPVAQGCRGLGTLARPG